MKKLGTNVNKTLGADDRDMEARGLDETRTRIRIRTWRLNGTPQACVDLARLSHLEFVPSTAPPI
jgi:hypothetical protein